MEPARRNKGIKRKSKVESPGDNAGSKGSVLPSEKEESRRLAEEVISSLRSNYPCSKQDEESFNALFKAIVEDYGLVTPVEQLIANRAATQFLNLQYCQEMLKKYGLFYVNNVDGKEMLKVNELAYFIKQLESEFRANLRMIQKKKPLDSRVNPIDNFLLELQKAKK